MGGSQSFRLEAVMSTGQSSIHRLLANKIETYLIRVNHDRIDIHGLGWRIVGVYQLKRCSRIGAV